MALNDVQHYSTNNKISLITNDYKENSMNLINKNVQIYEFVTNPSKIHQINNKQKTPSQQHIS